MLQLKLKFPKSLKIEDKLKSYVIKNYGKESFNDDVSRFFTDIQQNRNVICKISQLNCTTDIIKQNIQVVTFYINQLFVLKSKVTFGKKDKDISIPFEWTDIVKSGKYVSHNIYFEYYNSLFLLALMYYRVALNLLHDNNMSIRSKEVAKEIGDSLRQTKSLIDIIKHESTSTLPVNESCPDLSGSFLQFLSTYLGGFVQVYTLKFLEFGNNYSLQAKIAMGASSLFKQSIQLTSDALVMKIVDEQYKSYLMYLSEYYQAEAYLKKCLEMKEIFNENGINFGEMLKYQELGSELLLQLNEKYPKLCGKYLNHKELETKSQNEANQWNQWNEDNSNIYHQPIVEVNPVLESQIIEQQKLPNDLQLSLSPDTPSSLDVLVSNEVTTMIITFKKRMSEEINIKLSQLETETTINAYINALELPPAVLGQSDVKYKLEPSLKEEIAKCQEAGGTNAMYNITNQIEQLSFELEKRLNYCHSLLIMEVTDESKNREQYGRKWILQSSNEINKPIKDQIDKCSQIIRNTRVYDSQAKQYVIDNTKNFELFNLTKKQFNEHLYNMVQPQLKASTAKQLTPDEEIIKKELNTLLSISNKIKEQIEKIFTELNNDSKYPPLFLGVLDSQTTEQAIYENQKQLYTPMFHFIEQALPKIKKHKDTINSKLQNMKLTKKPSTKIEPHPLSKELSVCSTQFQKHYMKLNKGLNYYKELQSEVTRIEHITKDFLTKRYQEHAALLQTLGNRFDNRMLQHLRYFSHDDPKNNVWTNMNVKGFVYKK